jgi:hypothetical protein
VTVPSGTAAPEDVFTTVAVITTGLPTTTVVGETDNVVVVGIDTAVAARVMVWPLFGPAAGPALLPAAESTIVMFPAGCPGVVGANWSVNVHDAPALSVAEDENGTLLQTALAREYPVPLTEMLVMVKGVPPVLLTERVCVLLLSTSTDPKLMGPIFE